MEPSENSLDFTIKAQYKKQLAGGGNFLENLFKGTSFDDKFMIL